VFEGVRNGFVNLICERSVIVRPTLDWVSLPRRLRLLPRAPSRPRSSKPRAHPRWHPRTSTLLSSSPMQSPRSARTAPPLAAPCASRVRPSRIFPPSQHPADPDGGVRRAGRDARFNASRAVARRRAQNFSYHRRGDDLAADEGSRVASFLARRPSGSAVRSPVRNITPRSRGASPLSLTRSLPPFAHLPSHQSPRLPSRSSPRPASPPCTPAPAA